jgi:hypothetical protein
MIYIKTRKPVTGGTFIGKSRIDGTPMYRFRKFEDVIRDNISPEDCQIITDSKGSVDYQTIEQISNEDKIKNMIEI